MKRFNLFTFGIFLLALGLGCSDDEGEDLLKPGKAALLFPENNKECIEGTIVGDTQSEVVFRWSASLNTDSYELKITNLDSGSKQSVTSSTTEAKATLQRGEAYSWEVLSKSKNSSGTGQSETWTFYNAGPPIENHVPFPASLVSPSMGAKVNEGNVTLKWSGSDPDDDIASYEVYLDLVNPPVNLAGTPNTNQMDVNVSKDNEYFWQVVSIDAIGNESTSEVFSFLAEEGDPGQAPENLVLDGEMNDVGQWTYKQLWTGSNQNVEHGFSNGEFKFKTESDVQQTNAVLWQEIKVEAGKTYQFNVKVRSEGTQSAWFEVYFGTQSVDDAGDDYTGGMDVFVKSFGANEECGVNAFDGSIFDVIKNGCPLPADSQLDANGRVTFSESDLTSNGSIYLVLKAGTWDGNFGTGLYIDNVELIEVN